ncbi:MAG: hypothetical protein C4526_12755 [Nitrospiraceae bacterium]|nr:MAG: hypothetical protein C4526_12755 [Nitrospiraceae bacterium]
MRGELVFHEKRYFNETSFQEIKIWKVPQSKERPHGFKYSFAFIVNNERIVCYDNAECKGDHKHFKETEHPYKFESIEQLWKDFMKDVRKFKETTGEG